MSKNWGYYVHAQTVCTRPLLGERGAWERGYLLLYLSPRSVTCLILYIRMTTIVLMNLHVGTLITNDNYSRHGHHRAISAQCSMATLPYIAITCDRKLYN